MIADRLVLHHTYQRGVAFDLSENRNHGTLVDVFLGSGGFSSALDFNAGDSAVRVQPSQSLAHLRAVRTQVQFIWQPNQHRRYNLIEAHASFAMFIHPDGSLLGTIYNQHDQWAGAQSAPGTVVPGQWHVAEFVHDGVSQARVYLDGALVGEGFSSPGPMRTIAPFGLAIGHWPDPGSAYTFRGHIAEARVWIDDPVADLSHLIDDCCIDRAGIEQQSEQLRDAELAGADMGVWAEAVLDIGRDAAYWLAQGSRADCDHARDLGSRLLTSYLTGDVGSFATVADEAGSILQARAPAAAVTDLTARMQEALGQLPAGRELLSSPDGGRRERLVDLLTPWCLDRYLPGPSRHDRDRPEPVPDRSIDPHTDLPPDQRSDAMEQPEQHESADERDPP